MNSKGHILWAQLTECNGNITTNHEFFIRDNNIFKAPMSDVVMPDGYRVGRFECNKEQFYRFKDVILSRYDRIIYPICTFCGGTGQDNPEPGKYHGICEMCNGTGKIN